MFRFRSSYAHFACVADEGNTKALMRGSSRSASHAACDRGRIEAPVLVSARRAVRVTRSTSFHLRESISPRRQPVRARTVWPPW